MDYQKAIEEFKNICKDQEDQSVQIPECVMVIAENINSSLNDLIEYRKLGTLEEVREAVEKEKAKKPIAGADVMLGRDDEGNPIWETDYMCAECGMGIAEEYVCCPYCGQAIDWSDEE